MKTVTLEKDYSIKLSSNVVDYIYPDYIFIPMYKEYKLQVGNKEQVKKEQLLLRKSDGSSLYSPVSGVVVGAKECLLANGNKEKCLVIENDFKEKLLSRTTMRKNIKQLSKNLFLEELEKKGILFSSDKNELSLKKLKNDKIGKIIINAIEDEPYIANNIFALKNNYAEILEILSFLANIYCTKENIIVLKNNDRENIEILSNILGTYPEISLIIVDDIYPIGKDIILSNYVDFDEAKTLMLSPIDLLSIYSIIKKNKNISERYITISGNAVVNPIIVNAKIGTSVKKIIEENIEFINNNEVLYVVNGLMCGFETNIDDLIITNELNGIIINYKESYVEESCINCGKCLEVCPVNIDPNMIFNKKKNIDLKGRCIKCGLCTYICPVYINFKKKIEELQNEK